jgi:hypothetical protein
VKSVIIKKHDFSKRLITVLVLALFIAQAALPAWAEPVPLDEMKTRAIRKSEAALDETDMTTGGARKANVLFLVEATPPMIYTPKGVTPTTIRDWDWYNNEEAINWKETKRLYGMDFDDINRANWHATFGIGMMPPAWTGQDMRKERNLYGRERLPENNFKRGSTPAETLELNKNDYYFPFKDPGAAKKVEEAYRSQRTKLETHFTGVPGKPDYSAIWNTNTTGTQGVSNTAPWKYDNLNASKGFPYALVFKNPAYWAVPPSHWTQEDLVPNDSRMYQTKLVLWRLLEDESLFRGIRFGLATTFLSPANGNTDSSGNYNSHYNDDNHTGIYRRTDMNGIFRVEPYGSNVPSMRFFEKDAAGNFKKDADGKLKPSRFFEGGEFRPRERGTRFPVEITKYDSKLNPLGIEKNKNPGAQYGQKWYTNGILTSPITGHLRYFSGIHGQYIILWQNLPIGLNYSMNSTDPRHEGGSEWSERWRSSYRILNRASLHVPINDYSHKWEKIGKDGRKVAGMEISHADKFRLWINGFADIKSGGTNYVDPLLTSSGEDVGTKYPNHSNRWKQWHFYNDPEIGAAGSFSLPQAIFPDPRPGWDLSRQIYADNGWIWYSLKKRNVNYIANFNQYSAELDAPGIPRAFFNAGSGEAAGSVLDFFSPPVFKNGLRDFTIPFTISRAAAGWWDHNTQYYMGNYALGNEVYVSKAYPNDERDAALGGRASGSDAVTWKDLDDVSYPIRSACENNWVILITSGQEVEPEDVPGAYRYSAADAIKNLYDYTRDNKVTMLERNADGTPKTDSSGNYDLKEVKLDKPIRTIVIGIVADPDKMDPGPERDQVIKMRKNVTRMARAGRGEDPDYEGSEIVPFFADDTETLFEDIKAALAAVNESQVQQPGAGAMAKTPPMEGEAGTSNMFATTYRIIEGNQWDAALTRYVVSEDSDGNTTVSADWELGRNLLNSRGGRNLKYWGQGSAGKGFMAWNGAGLAELLGMTDARVTAAGLGISGYSPPMEEAFYRWFQGYDFSYKKSGETAEYMRSSMLADIGKSGVEFGDYPKSADTLPGYAEWGARHVQDDSKLRLYAQGNDGILHVIEPKTGRETDAILLPPVLLPWRLATLKTDVIDGKVQWRNVAGGEKSTPGLRSNPAYILDGSLQKRRIDMNEDRNPAGNREWGTYLLGTMGKAGSGLYMLKLADPAFSDLTDPSKPQFSWYREKLGDMQISMYGDMTKPSIVPSADVTGEEAAFSNLGFNSPIPAMGVTGWAADKQKNFIALAGGTQSAYDPANNGREGAVLLFLDPSDGSIIRAFGSGSVNSNLRIGGGVTGKAPYMGMMVSPPTLVRSDLDDYRAGKVYASDNRGNIFRVKLEDDGGGTVETLAPDRWTIDTIATLQENYDEAISSTDNYSVPHGLVCGSVSNSSVWLAGGTADVGTRISDSNPAGIISNKKQMIFAFRDDCSISRTAIRGGDWKQLTREGSDALEKSGGKSGWFIPLEEDKQTKFREYVSAKPVITGGVLFVPTFIQRRPIDPTDASVCGLVRNINGDSRLYAVDLTSGGGEFWNGDDGGPVKYITLEGIKITGMNLVDSKFGKRLIARYDILAENPSLIEKPRQRNVSRVSGASNLIQIRDLYRGGSDIDLPPGATINVYWIMK